MSCFRRSSPLIAFTLACCSLVGCAARAKLTVARTLAYSIGRFQCAVPTGNVEILVEAQCAFTAGQCGTHPASLLLAIAADACCSCPDLHACTWASRSLPRTPAPRGFVALHASRTCWRSFASLSRVDFPRCAATQDLIEQTTVLLETMPENMVLCMVRASCFYAASNSSPFWCRRDQHRLACTFRLHFSDAGL